MILFFMIVYVWLNVVDHVLCFDSGATNHITSLRDLFSLEDGPNANTITWAKNVSYLVKGVGSILLVAKNGNSLKILDALYIPRIKKNMLSIFFLEKLRLVVKFVVNDRYMVHDLRSSDTIVASSTLFHGLYKLNDCKKNLEILSYTILDFEAILHAKLWLPCFGHLGFDNPVTFLKKKNGCLWSPFEVPSKHVYEGCVLGKM